MSARRSVAAEAAPLWREVLERVLVQLDNRSPRREREDVRRAVEQALASMQRLEETELSDPQHLVVLDEAKGHLAPACEAAAKLDDGGELARRLEQVVRAMQDARAETLEAVVLVQSAPPPARPRAERPVEQFFASVGVPRVHALTRAFVKPSRRDRGDVDLDEAWRVLEREAAEAEVEGPDALDDTAFVPGGEDVWQVDGAPPLRRIVRDALEDIGAMGLLRRVRGRAIRHEGIGRFEQRLLDNVDALIVLARPAPHGDESDAIDVLFEVRRFADDAFTYDPMRAFACTFFLGCVEGADPVRAALGALRRASPYTREAHIEALALAPNPEVGEAMRRLSAEDDPALVRMALEVMRFRGEGDFGTAVVLLSHSEALVRASAARCLALCDARDAAREALEAALDEEQDGERCAVMAEALLVLDSPAAVAYARRALKDASRAARPDPAARAWLRLLSLGGSARDVDLLASWASEAPAWIRAVGWLGAASLLEPMLESLSGAGGYRARLVARTIERITGEQLAEETGRSVTWRIEPRDFRAFWAERKTDYDEGKRLRFGRPFTAEACIAELERDGSSGDERESCSVELATITGGRARIEPHDWVARQREQAARARLVLEDKGVRAWHKSGEWLADRLGKRR